MIGDHLQKKNRVQKFKTYPFGMAALGHKVPLHRMEGAFKQFREINPEASTEDITRILGRCVQLIEEDNPYGAQMVLFPHNPPPGQAGDYRSRHPPDLFMHNLLDLTGALRVYCYLLTG
jgi:hypothetical protein